MQLILSRQQALLRLQQLESANVAGGVTCRHQPQSFTRDRQRLLLMEDLLIQVGNLPVPARGSTDQGQRGIAPVQLRGDGQPFGLFANARQLAP